MYHTPAGDRVLRSAEARLFMESLGMLVDILRDMEVTMGFPAWDDLQRNQQIALFHTVARALLREDEPIPPLTAVVESAVGCVYQHIRDMLEVEVEEPRPWIPMTSWRQLVLAASRETQIMDKLPHEDSRDKGEWNLLVECLESRVLWDHDWQLEGSIDLDPDASRRVKDELGISDDYFVAVPPDPSDAEAQRLLQELIALTTP
jgi:hypothetical protein